MRFSPSRRGYDRYPIVDKLGRGYDRYPNANCVSGRDYDRYPSVERVA